VNRRPAIVLSGSMAVAFTAAAALAAAGGQSVHPADAKVAVVATSAPAVHQLRHVRAASPPRWGRSTVSDAGSGSGSGSGGPAIGAAAPPSPAQPGEQRGSSTTEMSSTTEPDEHRGTTTTIETTTTSRPSPTTTEPDDDRDPTTTEPGEANDG
jgi:hypothetical protein